MQFFFVLAYPYKCAWIPNAMLAFMYALTSLELYQIRVYDYNINIIFYVTSRGDRSEWAGVPQSVFPCACMPSQCYTLIYSYVYTGTILSMYSNNYP